MCGRAKLASEFSQIKITFQIPPEYPTPNGPHSDDYSATNHG
jgi:hypothetical protein